MTAFIASNDILVLDFLIVKVVKYLDCGLVSLQHNDRLPLWLLVVHRYDHVFAHDVIYFENYMLVDFPGDVAQNNHFCCRGVLDDALPAKWRV